MGPGTYSGTYSVIQRIDYDEWGQITLDTNPGFQPFGFAGGIYDIQTKLIRFGARDHDAQAGRWTAPDPMRFRARGSNLYQYALDTPQHYSDPSGLYSVYENCCPGTGEATLPECASTPRPCANCLVPVIADMMSRATQNRECKKAILKNGVDWFAFLDSLRPTTPYPKITCDQNWCESGARQYNPALGIIPLCTGLFNYGFEAAHDRSARYAFS